MLFENYTEEEKNEPLFVKKESSLNEYVRTLV